MKSILSAGFAATWSTGAKTCLFANLPPTFTQNYLRFTLLFTVRVSDSMRRQDRHPLTPVVDISMVLSLPFCQEEIEAAMLKAARDQVESLMQVVDKMQNQQTKLSEVLQTDKKKVATVSLCVPCASWVGRRRARG